MAECTEYVAMQVTGAGTSSANGIFIPYSTKTEGGATYTIWTKDGLDSYPRIDPLRSFSTLWRWLIISDASTTLYRGGGPVGGSYWDSTGAQGGGIILNCPDATNEYGWVAVEGSAPTPTVTGLTQLPEQPVSDPIALRNAKYSTATESGSARFRRLLALGYV